MPPVGTHHNRPGALAFALYWFQALDWGYATTDSTLAKTLYAKSCTDCARFMHNFDDALARREHFRGGRSLVTATHIVSIDARAMVGTVDVTMDVSRLETLDATGKVVGHTDALPAITHRVWMRWAKSRWLVVDFKRVVWR